jgi:LacI family transcriptional regulator
MQATIKDVAHRAEVSVGTVSRVLRGEPNVPDSTISKVQKAITALNYSRLRKPRAVHAEKPLLKKNIGLLLLGMDRSLANLPSVASGIHGAEAALNDAGGNVILSDLPLADRLPEMLARKSMHGVIIKGALQGQLIQNANAELIDALRALPTAWLLGRPQQADWGDEVGSNDIEVGRLAAEYLVSRGHRRIAVLAPKPDHVTLGQRTAAFQWNAKQNGADVVTLLGKSSDWKLPLQTVDETDLVEKLFDRFMQLKKRPTAIFVPADSIAAGVYRACAKRKLVVGEDVSLISANNEQLLLAGLYPELTTIDVRAEQIGQQAVEQLIWRLAHRDDPLVSRTIHPTIVEGCSVACLN